MTECEYRDPPSDTEHKLYLLWSSFTPYEACRSAFWANLTLEHVRENLVDSKYLAANGAIGGAERIDSALCDNSERGAALVDSCVRTVLRRLGGLPEARGKRSIYADCVFARAWWRERMVAQAGGDNEQLRRKIRFVLRINQTYWEKLIDRIVFRNSTFGSVKIRNSLLRSLGQFLYENRDSELAKPRKFQCLCRRSTACQGRIELSVLDDGEIDAIMQDMIQSTISLQN